MMRSARYADGRSALAYDAGVEIAADGLRFEAAGADHVWPYGELARADDGNGRLILRRQPDTGERLALPAEAAAELRAAAPALFSGRALGRESPWVPAGLTAAAAALAALFLIGVPMAAEPLSAFVPAQYEAQISRIAWGQVEAMSDYCEAPEDSAGYAALDALHDRLAAHMQRQPHPDASLNVVTAGFPNAFALPDGSVVITDKLIALAESPDELAGVIAHELGHVEQRHVIANVIRQVGAGVFFDVVFGGAGAGQVIALASVNLAGLRFSRADEAEADARGLDFMDQAGINPGGLADMFERLRAAEPAGGDFPTLLASHPPSAERAAAARARAAPGRAPALDSASWRAVKTMCGLEWPAAPPEAPPEAAPNAPMEKLPGPDAAPEAAPVPGRMR